MPAVRQFLFLLLGACSLLHGAPAWANGRPPAPVSINFSSDANRVLVGTTFGAVLSNDAGATWRWICEPALQMLSGIDPVFVWLPNQDIMATSYDALLLSHDGGCNWEAHDGFASVFPTDFQILASNPNALWVTSGQTDQSTLYASQDAGQSFTPLFHADALYFASVAVAPSNPNVLALIALDSGSPAQAYLYESADAGRTWSHTPLPFSQFSVVRLLGIHPTQPNVVFMAATQAYNNTGALWRRGASDPAPTLVLQAPTPLRNLVFSNDGQTVWAASNSGRQLSTDGGQSFTPQAVPSGDACVQRRGDILYTCGDYHYDDWSVAQSIDQGATWTGLLSFPNVQGPLQCPAGSVTQKLCPAQWGPLAKSIGAAGASAQGRQTLPGLAGSSGINNSCTCGATAVSLPLALLAVLWRRIRRG